MESGVRGKHAVQVADLVGLVIFCISNYQDVLNTSLFKVSNVR